MPSRFPALACFALAFTTSAFAQATQISVTNAAADAVLKGNYNPADYQAATEIGNIAVIAPDMAARISKDTLAATLTKLATYYNRNTGTDTVSGTQGIGAARRWVYSRFQAYGAQYGGRLLPSYLQFTQAICGMNGHKDVFAVLPGRDTSNHGVLIVEGHLDSRCENNCDITCKAQGADDDGSGVALVLELARVLPKYTFNRTLVFLVTTAEEQGLYGAYAFRDYCVNAKIPVTAVQNNDVVGGIICGPTASPPGCTTPGALDSTHVRIFSTAINFSMNKSLARFIKGQYEQWLKPSAAVPMTINIMDPTDRTGRGGDHEPFSEVVEPVIPALRFTESFENGNGSPPPAGRQHSTLDVIGDDLNNDGNIDQYYVNYDYLVRNTQINGIGLIGGALGPQPPAFTLTEPQPQRYILATLTAPTSPVDQYKAAVRVTGNDFAVVYAMNGTTFTLPDTKAGTTYYVATASVDGNGAQSLYTQEQSITASVNGPPPTAIAPREATGGPGLRDVRIAADRITWILEAGNRIGTTAALRIVDAQGRTLRLHTFRFAGPRYEATLGRDRLPSGAYRAVLEMGGKTVSSRPLVL